MITLVKAAERYACPVCEVPIGGACGGGKVHPPRLNLASGDKDVVHMAVESMIHAENPRDWKDAN